MMWALTIVALPAALLSTVSAVAIFPARQAPSAPQCAPTTVTTTVYVPLVATKIVQPDTVTVVLYDSQSIAAQASSDASVDTEYESEQSQLNPVSAAQPLESATHTHVLTAPAFKATEDSRGNYWLDTPSTTTWGNLPTGDHAPVGTTTVIVGPHPAHTGPTEGHEVNDTVTYTVSPFPASASGSASQASGGPPSGSALYGYANLTSSMLGPASSAGESAVLTYTTTAIVATATLSVDFNVTAPSSTGSATQSHPSGTGGLDIRDPKATCTKVCYGRFGCWCNNWGGPGITLTDTDYVATTTAPPWTQLHPVTSLAQIVPRQTCTLVGAPGYGSWCNNYEGTTTNDYTVWDTTTTPGVVTSSAQESTDPVSATGTASSESPAATPSPTACGQTGPFEVSFDQLPPASIPMNDTTDHPPIDQFIDHLLWGLDWTYGPPPNEPFAPHDQPHLGWYIPKLNDNDTDTPSHNTGSIPDGGSFGAGGRKDNSSFWFNAKSAYAACDNLSEDPNYTCDFVATAFQYANGDDQVTATQHFTIPPCQANTTCQLQPIKFNKLFTNLSAMSLYANVQGQIKAFYMDSLQLDWSDNNCTAGLERVGSP